MRILFFIIIPVMNFYLIILMAAGSAGLLVPRARGRSSVSTPPPRDFRRTGSPSTCSSKSISLTCHESTLSSGVSSQISSKRPSHVSDVGSRQSMAGSTNSVQKRPVSTGSKGSLQSNAEAVNQRQTGSQTQVSQSEHDFSKKTTPPSTRKTSGKEGSPKVSSVKRPQEEMTPEQLDLIRTRDRNSKKMKKVQKKAL